MISKTLCRMLFVLIAAAPVASLLAGASDAAERVLVVEQNREVVKAGKDGFTGKDVLQKVYMTANWIRVDEHGGADGARSESRFIDFTKRQIITIDFPRRQKEVESFAEKQKGQEELRAQLEDDLEHMSDGPQKTKMAELWKGLLDGKRKFETLQGKKAGEAREAPASKRIAGANCDHAIVRDKKDRSYHAISVYLHPTVKMPCRSAEALYLLELIGAKLARFLEENSKVFGRLPMEMEIIVATGGRAHTQVTKVEWLDIEDLKDDPRWLPDFPAKRERRP